MTHSIPPRYLNILRILARHQNDDEGLSNAELLKLYIEEHGKNSKNPANIDTPRLMASCVFNMKNPKLKYITSNDTVNGKRHKITRTGLELLKKIDQEHGADHFPEAGNIVPPPPDPPQYTTSHTDVAREKDPIKIPLMAEPVEALKPSDPASLLVNLIEQAAQEAETIDPFEQFDQAVAVIRSALVQASTPKPAAIENKTLKIDTLKKLELILSRDIGDVLSEIINDLETIE